jgi:single-strand DNA-binding protein
MATEQFSKVQLQGLIASDPEIRYLTSGIPVASLTVSVKREFEPGRFTTDFLDVVVIGDKNDDGPAENAACFSRDQLVSIEGQLVMQRWEDKRGVQRQRMVVKALTIEHCEVAVGA